MSAPDSWEGRWTDPATWTEYIDLVSTIADEALPSKFEIGRDYRHDTAADVVFLIVEDSDLRALLLALLGATDATGDVEVADRCTCAAFLSDDHMHCTGRGSHPADECCHCDCTTAPPAALA